MKKFEKEASTMSSAGEKERFLHDGKVMESITKTGSTTEKFSQEQISGNFRLMLSKSGEKKEERLNL